MMANKYPIGIQSFPKLIEGGYTYVDKTRYIGELAREGQYIFLSRPRRFGKSLLLSTIEAYFEGRRELFNGLDIDSMDMDWMPRAVLRFDFNSENFTIADGLELHLDTLLRSYEKMYGRQPEDITPSQRLRHLIEAASAATGRKVVILVDEYDKPLLQIEDNSELYDRSQNILKSFFSNLKSMDAYIEFAMLTGVSRFSKVSIFSDLNNLKDISMYDRYQEICGWTEDELSSYFSVGIHALSARRRETPDETLTQLRQYYDGYLFSEEGSRLYNPFSVMMALDSGRILPYWFGTGTPTFLARRIKSGGLYPPDLNGALCTQQELTAVGINDHNPIPLMFQTGYLTIDSYRADLDMYELRFPNREVEIGFYQDLLQIYVPTGTDPGSGFNFKLFKIDLTEGRPEEFMKRLSALFKSLPGEDHRESTYRAITYLLAVLSGNHAMAEHHSYKGRSDVEVVAGRYIYVFEFKYNRSVEEAMVQIHARDYAGRYGMDGRKVFLIGANFNEDKDRRGLEYRIEEI